MLIAFTFKAKPGKESEFEALLNNPESARHVTRLMGASRNTLFLGDGRMIRVLEFPEGANPVGMGEIAAREPQVKDFLRQLGPLVEDGFDVDEPGSLEAFSERITYPLAFDVRV